MKDPFQGAMNKKMWFCDTSKKDINITTKYSHVNFPTQTETKVKSRTNTNLTLKTYRHLNPDFLPVDNLVESAFDDCLQHFQRFKEN